MLWLSKSGFSTRQFTNTMRLFLIAVEEADDFSFPRASSTAFIIYIRQGGVVRWFHLMS